MTKQEQLIKNINTEYLEEKNKKHTNINSIWEQYQKMGRELSEGIYSDDNHFIYEIIQNAEDTKCEDKQHILEFSLEDKGLLIFNNESGFNEEQIKAICSFGKSTKSKDKDSGYIGEKGIGFKSVFKITDFPAISSNGFRFYFKRFDEFENTEYIIPHWIEDDELQKYPDKFINNTHTTLYLPFSTDKKENSLKKLKSDIKNIEPILLLFLKKLNNIKITQSGIEKLNTIKKETKDENLFQTSIENQDRKEKYFLFKKQIDVDQNLDEIVGKNGRRKDVKTREIVLAFPNFKNKNNDDRIFAFLPTKLHSGLKYLIQADFILQSGRENIATDSEWNNWQFKHIEEFIKFNIIEELKNHSNIRYEYLNYFLRYGNSHNHLIEKLHNNIIKAFEHKQIILDQNESWQLPQNILIVEDCEIETKYLKLLFGINFEQKHKKFSLDDYFIEQFKIRKINPKVLIEEICKYFDSKGLEEFEEDEIFYFTKFLSKNLTIDSRANHFNKDSFERVKKSIPIIPKYSSNKKFYLYDSIYLSSEYVPDIIIENFTEKENFDFTKYNFLSDKYKEHDNKKLEDFIKKIIEEQKENKNKKTISFFEEYPEILHLYLKRFDNYKKILDFLIDNQMDNKERISKIKLLLADDEIYYNSNEVIYFSNDSSSQLKILNVELLNLVNSNHKYKEFLKDVFKIKEADVLNIILETYLPDIKKIKERSPENDEKLIEYTKQIIHNFDKFDKDEQDRIKKGMLFISSNQKETYLRANNIYLPQDLSQLVFEKNSIEKYINERSIFDFLDSSYNKVIENIDETKVKDFFMFFPFEKRIKEKDIKEFIKYIKQLEIDESISSLELICSSIDDKKKYNEIETLYVYSNKKVLVEIKDLFSEKLTDLDIPYLNTEYIPKLGNYLKYIKQYFASEYDIEPFIKYLKNCTDFNDVVNVYKYLESKNEFDPNKKDRFTITSDKIRSKFANDKLIFDKNLTGYYPSDVTWKEEKSSTKNIALSNIYPPELENFFVKKVQVSQSKDIKQIINHIKTIKEANNEYFDLLIDLSSLVSDSKEIEKFYKSNKSFPQFNNIIEGTRKFILEKERIFILEDGNKNINAEFYFNDLEIKDFEMDLTNRIFSVNNSYPISHYGGLIDSLGVKRLSSLNKTYHDGKFIEQFDVDNYRKLLHFSYDLLFTKYPDYYKELDNRRNELTIINMIEKINLFDNIYPQLKIDNNTIHIDSEKFYIKNKILNIVDERDIFRILAEKIKYIDDKTIKDFYNEVIIGDISKNKYYEEEKYKEKRNFTLEISDQIIEEENTSINNEQIINLDFYEENSKRNQKELYTQSAEEEREHRRKALEQIRDHEKSTQNDLIDEHLDPYNVNNIAQYQKSYNELKNIKLTNYKNNSSKKVKSNISSSKIGNEETKDKFRQRNWYGGHCQICGYTFKTNKGNYFERFTWTDFKKRNWSEKQKEDIRNNCIDEGNSLCLCAKCHSIIKNGGQFKANFLESIENKLEIESYSYDEFVDDIKDNESNVIPEKFLDLVEFNDMFGIKIELDNRDERIYFIEEHLLAFFLFLKD